MNEWTERYTHCRLKSTLWWHEVMQASALLNATRCQDGPAWPNFKLPGPAIEFVDLLMQVFIIRPGVHVPPSAFAELCVPAVWLATPRQVAAFCNRKVLKWTCPQVFLHKMSNFAKFSGDWCIPIWKVGNLRQLFSFALLIIKSSQTVYCTVDKNT